MNAISTINHVPTSHPVHERDDFQVGETVTLSRRISKGDIQAFAALTGDTNPIHLDEDYARETLFNGCIAHGILIAGLISAVLGTQLPGPGGIYISQQFRFTAAVHPGDEVTVAVQVTAWDPVKGRIVLQTDVSNQAGLTVVTGEAHLVMRAFLKSR